MEATQKIDFLFAELMQVLSIEVATDDLTNRGYENFNDTLEKLVKTRNDQITSQVIYLIFNFYYKALKLARLNRVALAKEEIQKGDSFADMLEGEPKDVVASIATPIKAYYEYKVENFAVAKDLLIKTFNIDAELEEKGYYILIMHRVQALHNLARMYFKSTTSEGFSLSCNLLNLLLESSDLDFENCFIEIKKVKAVNWGLKSDMYFQILDELVFQLILNPSYESEIIQILKQGLLSNKYNQLDQERKVVEWIRLNEMIDGRPLLDNLNEIITFFRDNIRRTTNLKTQLIIKIYFKLIKELNFHQKEVFAERLKVYIQNNKSTPDFFKKLILKSVSTEHVLARTT